MLFYLPDRLTTGAVLVAQPARISSGIGSSATRIARLANEIESMGGGLREGFDPAGAFGLPFARISRVAIPPCTCRQQRPERILA